MVESEDDEDVIGDALLDDDDGDEEEEKLILDWTEEDDDDDNVLLGVDDEDDAYYKLMIPDDPYFLEKEKLFLFKCLLDVENLQFSLLDVSKQIDLIDSLVVSRHKPGDLLYSQGIY